MMSKGSYGRSGPKKKSYGRPGRKKANSGRKSSPTMAYGRKDRLIQERRHDVYESRGKWSEGTQCPTCEAVYTKGRWSWHAAPSATQAVLCPACQRVNDHYPAGFITLKGAFFEAHREELINLVRNVEKREKAEHPLERLMALTDEDDHVLATTTGIHIARRIGEALARSYEGTLAYQYGDGEKTIRVAWER